MKWWPWLLLGIAVAGGFFGKPIVSAIWKRLHNRGQSKHTAAISAAFTPEDRALIDLISNLVDVLDEAKKR